VARQYNFWLHFFHEKRKKQFIPLPWKIGYFIFRNINKIDEFASHFNNVSLKYVEKIKGFDPNKIFVEHMLSVGFSNSFIQTTLNEEEEEGNNQSTPVHEAGDLETILSTNELYKQKGKGPSERSAQSPVVTPKLPHPGAMLQWLTQLEIFPTVVQAVEERRIPPWEN
jgi:hypothetical protein